MFTIKRFLGISLPTKHAELLQSGHCTCVGLLRLELGDIHIDLVAFACLWMPNLLVTKGLATSPRWFTSSLLTQRIELLNPLLQSLQPNRVFLTTREAPVNPRMYRPQASSHHKLPLSSTAVMIATSCTTVTWMCSRL